MLSRVMKRDYSNMISRVMKRERFEQPLELLLANAYGNYQASEESPEYFETEYPTYVSIQIP